MILPLDWLKQLVNVNEPIEAMAQRLVDLGFECEQLDANRLDLEITPNRGDALSIVGLAREYAASTNQTIRFPETNRIQYGFNLDGFQLEVQPVAYHRLAAIMIRDI